ncbi:MAG: T9SS type A sorting domain-containing protein [Bacteroidales bacterium]|nr:T9SS type A sorting domain-containing protein [Bacteroidales bacterium]
MKFLVPVKISAKVLISGIIFIMISMSVEATNYYVSLTGSNSNAGTSAEAAWRTITYAATQAKAGDLVYIQGGNYGHEHVVVSNSGTSSAPIIFEGYDGTPVLDGDDWLGYGIYIIGKQYITIKGLRVKNYRYGIWVSNQSHYATIDGCVADSCCNTNYTSYGYDGYGFLVQDCDYSTIKNCSATDNGGDNIFLSRSHYCTIQNCQTYSKQTASNQFITDYYIVLAWGSHNVIRDCICEDINGSYKGNHGFIIKDNPGSGGTETHSTDNRIINCTAKKFEEGFVFAHQAYGNTVDSCYADNTGKSSTFNFCFQNRDGANNNTFSNCRGVGKTGVASVYDGTEGTNPQNQDNTLFVNCSLEGIMSNTIGVFLRNTTNTTFKNCNFINIPNMFRFSKSSTGSDDNSGTVIKNCILSGVAAQYDVSSLTAPWSLSGSETGYSDMENVSATYTDFYNGFEIISGAGNISSDPLFASTTDFHLRSQGGRWNGTAWVNDDVTSSCIDAGDPADTYSDEPTPNGNRINIGAYGNTITASKSSGTSSVRDWEYQNFIKAYPNPVSSELTIEVEVNNEKVNFEILNALGQKVFRGNFIERTIVYTNNWKPGAYFIKFEIGKKIVVKKIIKK